MILLRELLDAIKNATRTVRRERVRNTDQASKSLAFKQGLGIGVGHGCRANRRSLRSELEVNLVDTRE
jgi:hypothetical protein